VEPVGLEVFFDYHCPYSERAIRWLELLGPQHIRPRYRFFPLEQVNRDAVASEWRLWEQPLDYEHYRGRQDRRALQSFLVTALLEADEVREVVSRFRLAVLDARFREEADLSDLALLRRVAADAGADAARLEAALADPVRVAAARERIADDWHRARGEYLIFGVPTLRLAEGAPFYLRLEREPGREEAVGLFDRLIELRRAAPFVLELKVPERTVVPHAVTA
jgi:hypothetical protein